MQDIHSIGGGRFFAGGGGGGGDRRLRQHQHQQAQPQALKCPRCDSANTKFCYYNNYNLSQPRHFCKSCRRYWTKGGVLRNVPVGGGCRKTKRSKQKSSSSSVSAAAARDLKSSNSHSSSESSSLTATTTNAAAANATEAVSAPPSSNPSFSDQPPTAAAQNSLLEGGSSECGSLFLEIGSFASLIATSSSAAAVSGAGVGVGVGVGVGTALPFEFGSIAPFRLNHHHNHHHHHLSQSWNQQKDLSASIGVVNRDHRDQELKVREIGSAGGLMVDQTAQVDLSVLQQDRSNGGGFGSLGDWQQCGDQGLFDLTNTVDQQYWSQNQWNDQDHPGLYLP